MWKYSALHKRADQGFPIHTFWTLFSGTNEGEPKTDRQGAVADVGRDEAVDGSVLCIPRR